MARSRQNSSGLRLLLKAAEAGRRAVFFTLEYTEAETRARLTKLQGSAAVRKGNIEIVASDDICAGTIAAHLAGSRRGTVAVIDYLQILDQDRTKPPLEDQIEMLCNLARTQGFVLGVLSQINRRFDPAQPDLPKIGDVRLPNPLAMKAFSKACFLHAGRVRFEHSDQGK